ncbi:MAG: TatD family hydrolase [Anaerolineales bacterium]|jgi:TatD DNase family protein
MTSSPAAIADTHCHLVFSAFKGDLKSVIHRAEQAGVNRIMVPGIDLESSQAAVNLAGQHPMIFASVGIHPHSAGDLDETARQQLARLATSPKVVAIGEIGLDYYRNLSPPKAQQEAFRWQLDLARKLDLPVVIHCREAIDEVCKTLLKWSMDTSAALHDRLGVMHSYSYDAEHAAEMIEAGFYIGISGPVTFRKADELRQTVKEIPLNRLLTETDAPYLTPQPFRGKRNEPAYVIYVAETLGKIHNQPYANVAQRTFANAGALFKWSHEFDYSNLQ